MRFAGAAQVGQHENDACIEQFGQVAGAFLQEAHLPRLSQADDDGGLLGSLLRYENDDPRLDFEPNSPCVNGPTSVECERKRNNAAAASPANGLSLTKN